MLDADCEHSYGCEFYGLIKKSNEFYLFDNITQLMDDVGLMDQPKRAPTTGISLDTGRLSYAARIRNVWSNCPNICAFECSTKNDKMFERSKKCCQIRNV